MSARAPGAATDRTATLVERLAVLLRAGLAPTAAWAALARGSDHADRDGPTSARADDVHADDRTVPVVPVVPDVGEAGESVATALRKRPEPSWRLVACAWAVSERTGAPLSPSLECIAGVLRDLADAERARVAALAGPRATARLVLCLPVVAILLGAAVGLDPLGVLVGTPIGWACLAAGTVLVVLAWAWMRALVRRASARVLAPGVGLDLVALALRGGGPPADAVRLVRAEAARSDLVVELRPAVEVLRLAVDAGIPAGVLLHGEAALARRRERAATDARVARLGVALVLPLGVCVLPAFVAVGIVPLLVAVVGDLVEPGVLG